MKGNIISAMLTIALSVLCLHSIAQDSTTHKLRLGLTGGYTIVSGNFAKTGYSDLTSGFAANGVNVGLNGNYRIKGNVGIKAVAAYTAFGHKGLQNLGAGFKEDFAVDSVTVYRKGANYSISLLVGPYYDINLDNNWLLSLYATAGLVNTHLAGYQVDLEDNDASSFSQKETSKSTIGINCGTEVHYKLSDHFSVGLSAAYYYSKPNFAIENVNRKNNAGRLITSYNQPVTGINTNLMLSYNL